MSPNKALLVSLIIVSPLFVAMILVLRALWGM